MAKNSVKFSKPVKLPFLSWKPFDIREYNGSRMETVRNNAIASKTPRMIQSSRLTFSLTAKRGRAAAVMVSSRLVAVCESFPIHPDKIGGEGNHHLAALGNIEIAHQVDGKIGAKAGPGRALGMQ